MRHSDIVYNLVGRDYETKCVLCYLCVRALLMCAKRNFDYQSVNVAGAESIASVSAACGVQRLVHVSHLNASTTSPSEFYQTKAQGEERVKAVFPTATIVRPGAMFGFEDRLLNSIARACLFPLPSRLLRGLACLLTRWYAGSPWSWKLNHGATEIRPAHVSSPLNSHARNLM